MNIGPDALKQLMMRIEWMGLSAAKPQEIAVWGLTSFDPSHAKITLQHVVWGLTSFDPRHAKNKLQPKR